MPISQYDQTNYAAYTPISMQEMWAPAAMLREQQDKLQEDYSNAEQLAQQGFSGLNPEVDKEALGIQKQFMDQTKAAADELATKGFIDSGRRRSLLQLKSVYSNQVAPLQQQIALRASRAEELRKIQQEHPDFISVGNPMGISLTTGLKDPNAYNYTGMKGDVLTKSVADKAVELGKRIEGMPRYRQTNIPFNMFALLKSGASAEQVGKAMLHAGYKDEDAKGIVGELQNMVRGTLEQYGVDQKFGQDPTALKKAYDFANAGLYKAIGDNKPMSAEDNYRMHMAEQKAAQQQQIANDKGNIPSSTSYFEVNTDLGKKYADIEKTILTPNGQANAKYFGAHGEKNPLKEYETIQNFKKNSLNNFNTYVDNLSQKYLTKGMEIRMVDGQKVLANKDGTPIKGQLASEYQNLQREFRKQADEINKRTSISKDQYNHLKSIGVTPTDSYSNVVNKISTGKEFAQKAHVGYSLNLQSKGLDDLEGDIASKINAGKRILIPIDKKSFSLSSNEDVSEKDLLKGYDKDKYSSKIARAEYMPKFGGVVITNQNGDMFKVKEVMDNETTNIINTEAPLVDKYLKIAEDPSRSRSDRQKALDYVQNVSAEITRPIATRIAGFYQTPQATETSKNPDQVILQQNQK